MDFPCLGVGFWYFARFGFGSVSGLLVLEFGVLVFLGFLFCVCYLIKIVVFGLL